MQITCSVIICTRNRASFLKDTLAAFEKVRVPLGWKVEMVVADNGSWDHTAAVIASARHPSIAFRYVRVAPPGKSRAQNAAVACARGEVLLFTDDDVEPADNWIEKMAVPLLERQCDAVAGRILLGRELERPWFSHMHGTWLAVSPVVNADSPVLVGASMGVHRSVFEVIGKFDEELGPGASGFGEETLFWRQMLEAGLVIYPVNDTHVTHHPEPSRLLRANWLATAMRFGEGGGYILHHWEHAKVSFPALRAFAIGIKLYLRRFLQAKEALGEEGCPAWEMSYLVRIAMLGRYRIERKKLRKYNHRGLQKLG